MNGAKLETKDKLFDNVDIEAIPERPFRVLNALDVSIHRCLSKYEVIYQIIDKDQTDMTRSLVYLSWELVDWLERTRKILGHGAGLKTKEPAYKILMSRLASAESFRDELQHFNQFVEQSIGTDFAPLGSVTALRADVVKNGSCEEFSFLSFNLGALRGTQTMGHFEMPPKAMNNRVDHVTLHLGGEQVDLSKILEGLLAYYKQLRDDLAKEYPKPKPAS